jgi:diguanylate cyclase (GGDEF)-like protein
LSTTLGYFTELRVGTDVYGVFSQFWLHIGLVLGGSVLGAALGPRLSSAIREKWASSALSESPDGCETAHEIAWDVAIESLAHGVVIFNERREVLVCNRHYREMYDLSEEEVKPGTPLRNLVENRLLLGLKISCTPSEYLADMIERPVTAMDTIHEYADGRLIAYRSRPMPGGGGIATHEDVTEREALNRQLQEQNEIMEAQQEALWIRNTHFDAALNHMSQALCFFDKSQRLIASNKRFAEMSCLSPESIFPGMTLWELVNLRHQAGSLPNVSPEEYYAWRCGIIAQNKPSDTVVELANGRVWEIHQRPMPDGGWVATHEDITDRQRLHAQLKSQYELVKEQQEQLRQRTLQFDIAVNNMSQGLCFFDGEQKLIVCNRRYAEMYHLDPAIIHSGITLREIVDLRYHANTGAVMKKEQYRDWRNDIAATGEATDSIVELQDGRIFVIHHQPMADGGWVATHEDVTERQKLHSKLKKQYEIMRGQQEQLRQRNLLFDAAINNMSQGLCFFDKDQRLLVCNSRYIEMYDLDPSDVFPGVTLREIVDLRYAANTSPAMTPEDYYAWRSSVAGSNEASDTIVELANGRVFVIHHRPMAGGGWVATHEDITEQRRNEAKIAYMAQHDILTGLANRALLTEQMEHALTRAKRGELVALHLVDLDHFKRVNDTMGHPVGDLLLKAVSSRLRAITRETDTLARLGGDEFAVLQVGMQHHADATTLAQRIIEDLSAPYQLDGHEAIIGATVGIALAGTDGYHSDQLVRKADVALYRAKGAGRGAYRLFESEMDAEMQSRRALELELRQALPAGQLELRFQPTIRAQDESITGFEAVIYWKHPREGDLPPEDFLPLAEGIGLAPALGEWTLREACRAAASWPAGLKLAVNLSAVQFRNPGLPLVVVGALGASGLSPDNLELEVPEAALLNGGETTLPTLHRLRDLGVRVVMDDFGRAPSTVSYLRDFPFHKIKMGQGLVRDMTTDEDAANVVRAIAAIARGFGIVSTADGVTSAEHREKAVAEGCLEIQGALFGRPLRANELAAFLSSGERTKGRPATSAA